MSILKGAWIALLYANITYSFHSGRLRCQELSTVTTPYTVFIPSTKLYSKDADKSLDWDPRMAPKLDFNEDYYKVLEVDPSCDEKHLKKGYYKMVQILLSPYVMFVEIILVL